MKLRDPLSFVTGSARLVVRGGPVYYAWMVLLLSCCLAGREADDAGSFGMAGVQPPSLTRYRYSCMCS